MYTQETNKIRLAMWQVYLNHCVGEISGDGVYYKGEYKTFVDENFGNKYRIRMSGNESEQWNNAKRRILFILPSPVEGNDESSRFKDTYNRDMTHSSDGNLAFTDRVNANILKIAAGLQTITSKGYTPFDAVNNIEYVDKLWQETAVARINVVKDYSDIIDLEEQLTLSLKYFSSMLQGQIRELNPNIIVSCLGERNQELMQRCFADIQKVNDKVYYSQTENVWIIDSYDLASEEYSEEAIYNQIMIAFHEVIPPA